MKSTLFRRIFSLFLLAAVGISASGCVVAVEPARVHAHYYYR
jgi:hypothetical protein